MGDLEYILIWEEDNDKEVIMKRGLLDTVVATLGEAEHDGDKESEGSIFDFMDANAVDATVDAPYGILDRLPHSYLRPGDREAVVDGTAGFFRKETCYEIGMPWEIYNFYPHEDFAEESEPEEQEESHPEETPASASSSTSYDYDDPPARTEDNDDDEPAPQPVQPKNDDVPTIVTRHKTITINGRTIYDGPEDQAPTVHEPTGFGLLLAALGIVSYSTTTKSTETPLPAETPSPKRARRTKPTHLETPHELRAELDRRIAEYDSVYPARKGSMHAHIALSVGKFADKNGAVPEALLFYGRALTSPGRDSASREESLQRAYALLQKNGLDIPITHPYRAELLSYVRDLTARKA